jgi:hypothetical protein
LGGFFLPQALFHPDGVFLEQLIYQQMCSQYRKLKFFGSEDLCQKISLKVISCSMQKIFFGYIAQGGIFSHTQYGTNVQLNFFFTIPDVEHYLNLQTNV